jgi:hypothetical protein
MCVSFDRLKYVSQRVAAGILSATKRTARIALFMHIQNLSARRMKHVFCPLVLEFDQAQK